MHVLAGTSALAAAMTLVQPGGPPPAPVAYRLTPIVESGTLAALEVDLAFAGDPDGETRLVLPGEWAGSKELWRNIEGLRVRGATTTDDGPAALVLRHAPGAQVTVRYRLKSLAMEPDADFGKAVPIVRPGWFYLNGEGAFVTIDGRDNAQATFAWGARPAGWALASDLEQLGPGKLGTVNDVVESITIGAPDLKVVSRTVRGATVRIAMRGSWPSTAEQLADVAIPIIEASEDLWGDPGRPFLLTAGPLAGGTGGRISTNGTGRGDAFAILSTDNVDLSKQLFLLAHEYQHTWISRQVGGLPAADEALGYWFSEGFTDSFAARVLLRSGLWTIEDYIAHENELLVRYGTSPAREAPARQILGRFWEDQALQQLSYDRGRLLAVIWDQRLRQQSSAARDLDDVMMAQRRRAAANAKAGKVVNSDALFPAVFREVAGFGIDEDLAAHIERGAMVRLPADIYGPCATVRTAPMALFDRGFDGEASARTGVITGVDPAGPAYAAGLRDGMKRLGREGGREGDSSIEIGYRIADAAGGEHLVRYLPKSRTMVDVQRIDLAPGLDAAAREACRRRLAGL